MNNISKISVHDLKTAGIGLFEYVWSGIEVHKSSQSILLLFCYLFPDSAALLNQVQINQFGLYCVNHLAEY